MSEVSLPPDANSPARHHDAAGWALGALEPADAEAFGVHLRGCTECQVNVAEFQAMARALKSPAPAVEPPAELETKTVASVQHAVLAARQSEPAHAAKRTVVTPEPSQQPATTAIDLHAAPGQPAVASTHEPAPDKIAPEPAPAKISKWWHWHPHFPLASAASALAGAAVAVAVVMLIPVLLAAPALATIHMRSPDGGPASGLARVQRTPGGFVVHLTVRGLKPLGPGQVYACWYKQPRSTNWITAGSFKRNGSYVMTSAADPSHYTRMKIILERAGDPSPQGLGTVLTGRSAGP
jgi:hypothetical protein